MRQINIECRRHNINRCQQCSHREWVKEQLLDNVGNYVVLGSDSIHMNFFQGHSEAFNYYNELPIQDGGAYKGVYSVRRGGYLSPINVSGDMLQDDKIKEKHWAIFSY